MGASDGDQRPRLRAALPRPAAALQGTPLRQDCSGLGRRSDESAAAHQRVCGVEGSRRSVRRVTRARGQGVQHRRKFNRSRRARDANARRGARGRAGCSGRRVLRPHGEDQRAGRDTARGGGGSRSVPGISGKRRHHGSPLERRLGSLGAAGESPGRPNRSDVYTLRRIVPKDRGFTWGER